jgi:hypothetical protein
MVRRVGAALAVGVLLVACGAAYGTALDPNESGIVEDGGGTIDGTTCTPTETQCGNHADDDCDNATDCSDSDCAGGPACPSPRPKGQACTANTQCQSGFCADGVCCDSACTGGDCDACSVEAGARTNGTCTILSVTTVCRVSAGACDAPEKCDGVSAACPPDALQPTSYACRPSIGACDTAETCTAGGLACPSDVINCTVAPCSTNVACTGLPVGSPCSVGTQCTSGFCVEGFCCNDACNGGACQACSVAKGAPTNGKCALRAAGAACRGAKNACDAPEVCTGTSAACPADAPAQDGTPCGGGNVCSNGGCVPPCNGANCPQLTTCTVSIYDNSPAVWGTLDAPVNTDGTCVPPAGKTVTYTDFGASLDDGGAIYVNGVKVFSGDNHICSIKDSGYRALAALPAAGAPVSIRALNCVTAGAGGNITIRFFGY